MYSRNFRFSLKNHHATYHYTQNPDFVRFKVHTLNTHAMSTKDLSNLYRYDTCNSYTYLHSWIYISFSFQTFKLIHYQTFLSNTCKPILPMGRDTCTTNLIPQYLINCLHFQFTMLNTNKRLLFITPLTDIKENL